YGVLSREEQGVFRRFGVFAGGWTLDAAEQVAEASLDALQSLVEKSLVRFDGERYSLLETIREFAAEQLEESGELDETRRRHFEYFAGLAAREDTSAEAGYGVQPGALLGEGENFRAALDWADAAGELEPAAEMMVSLENFWVATDTIEGARRFEEVLASGDELPDRLRARITRCCAGSLWISGEYERSHQLNYESLAIFRELGDDQGIGVLLHRIGISTLVLHKDPAAARELLLESREHHRRAGSGRGGAGVIGGLGGVARGAGGTAGARGLFTPAAAPAAGVGVISGESGKGAPRGSARR